MLRTQVLFRRNIQYKVFNAIRLMARLKDIPTSQTFVDQLPSDSAVPTPKAASDASQLLLHESRLIQKALYTFVPPIVPREYKVLAFSPQALDDLGIDITTKEDRKELSDIVSGTKLWPGHYPWAQCYGGYQFGLWAGQLGDGRAISLVELTSPSGERYELQLKGAGKTAFGRFADGWAVLRSSIREFLGCEYSYALRIPTTRALSLTSLPKQYAVREQLESCAVVARMAPTWIRIGTFDLLYSRADHENIKRLADYCIDYVFGRDNLPGSGNIYRRLLLEIVRRNGVGVAHWQSYGFVNGVLNTDNTSILGLILDYGPYAFMDNFDSVFTSNHDDLTLRYCYKMQPSIIWWNLRKLIDDLGPLIVNSPEQESRDSEFSAIIEEAKSHFELTFFKTYIRLMRQRLGLQHQLDTDLNLINNLNGLLEKHHLDYNRFFRSLSNLSFDKSSDATIETNKFIHLLNIEFSARLNHLSNDIENFFLLYKTRVTDNNEITGLKDRLRSTNPKFVLRNWVLQDIISRVQNGDTGFVEKIMPMIQNPFCESWNIDKDIEERYCGISPAENMNSQCSCSS